MLLPLARERPLAVRAEALAGGGALVARPVPVDGDDRLDAELVGPLVAVDAEVPVDGAPEAPARRRELGAAVPLGVLRIDLADAHLLDPRARLAGDFDHVGRARRRLGRRRRRRERGGEHRRGKEPKHRPPIFAGRGRRGPVSGGAPLYDIVDKVSESLVGSFVDTRYELRRLIARGGMGLVFEAHHKYTRRTVALKVLHEELRSHDEAHQRLLREAHALATVRHPGFVEVLDAGICDTFGPYVVLEMLEGRTLEGILAARGRLSIDDTVLIGRQVCEAVAYANARGVIHRDIKPSNIFVARTELGREIIKIIDLGVAAVAGTQLSAQDRKLTTAHAVIGTPEYMAPEQLYGHEIDARTDVWGIGMTLFECVTGELPYAGSYPEVLVRVTNATEPPQVRARRPDVPAAVAFAIETALEKEASGRFRSAAELGRALVAASGVLPASSSLLALPFEQSQVSAAARDDEEPERAIKLVRKKPRAGPADRATPLDDDAMVRAGAAAPAEHAPHAGPRQRGYRDQAKAVRARAVCDPRAGHGSDRKRDRGAHGGDQRRGDAPHRAGVAGGRRPGHAAVREPRGRRARGGRRERALGERGEGTDGDRRGVHQRAARAAEHRGEVHRDDAASRGVTL